MVSSRGGMDGFPRFLAPSDRKKERRGRDIERERETDIYI